MEAFCRARRHARNALRVRYESKAGAACSWTAFTRTEHQLAQGVHEVGQHLTTFQKVSCIGLDKYDNILTNAAHHMHAVPFPSFDHLTVDIDMNKHWILRDILFGGYTLR